MLLIKKIILSAHALGCQLILRGFGSFIVKQRAQKLGRNIKAEKGVFIKNGKKVSK